MQLVDFSPQKSQLKIQINHIVEKVVYVVHRYPNDRCRTRETVSVELQRWSGALGEQPREHLYSCCSRTDGYSEWRCPPQISIHVQKMSPSWWISISVESMHCKTIEMQQTDPTKSWTSTIIYVISIDILRSVSVLFLGPYLWQYRIWLIDRYTFYSGNEGIKWGGWMSLRNQLKFRRVYVLTEVTTLGNTTIDCTFTRYIDVDIMLFYASNFPYHKLMLNEIVVEYQLK